MNSLLAVLPSDPVFYLAGYATVFIIAISKGTFGGGIYAVFAVACERSERRYGFYDFCCRFRQAAGEYVPTETRIG